MIRIYTQSQRAHAWCDRYRGTTPLLACVLGFTETGLIPGISAAGATPESRRWTAIADAEFLLNGVQPAPGYPLPPLQAGISPVFITRAIAAALSWHCQIFNAGLPTVPTVPSIDLAGSPARCLSTGAALDLKIVTHLWQQGLAWGTTLATQTEGYVILAECVVGGTTTALAILTALGIDAVGKVNSSHVTCNHAQKWGLVQQGIQAWERQQQRPITTASPLEIVAAVGDPMQIVVAGMAIAASRQRGILLAGGTQMLAVYALAQALVRWSGADWTPTAIAVGTTRWVAEDPTGDTVGLANAIGAVPLLATSLSFATASIPQLRVYEQGFVKEGVGAGGSAIAAHLAAGWSQPQLLDCIEHLVHDYAAMSSAIANSSE